MTTGGNDLILRWTHQSPNTGYEVWRGTVPYFTFSGPDAGTLLITLIEPFGSTVSYTDAGRFGDGANYYYVIRGLVWGAVAQSVGSGKFAFELEPSQ
jgi:hypothetical protein